MLDRLKPNGQRALIERNRTRPAEEIADAMIERAYQRQADPAQYDDLVAAEYGAPAGIYELDTRSDDWRVVRKCLLCLAVIGGIVAWAWWRQ